jgi:hypothetical protein
MRLSSMVSLLVVTASFALGGCAAEAEPTGGSNPDVALQEPTAPVATDRTADVTQTGKISDQFANPSDEVRARIVATVAGGQVNPRIDVTPSPFGKVPSEKIGIVPSSFNPQSPIEQAVQLEQGFTPYSHHPKP